MHTTVINNNTTEVEGAQEPLTNNQEAPVPLTNNQGALTDNQRVPNRQPEGPGAPT